MAGLTGSLRERLTCPVCQKFFCFRADQLEEHADACAARLLDPPPLPVPKPALPKKRAVPKPTHDEPTAKRRPYGGRGGHRAPKKPPRDPTFSVEIVLLDQMEFRCQSSQAQMAHRHGGA